MDPKAFDRLTQLLATRATRRTTALGAAASMALIPGMRALAQDATPASGTPEASGRNRGALCAVLLQRRNSRQR